MTEEPDIVERLRNYNTCSDTDVDEAADEIERLRKERDEARRKICEMEAECIVYPPCSPQQYAVRMGWDCFPDKAEADANNTLFRTTDGE